MFCTEFQLYLSFVQSQTCSIWFKFDLGNAVLGRMGQSVSRSISYLELANRPRLMFISPPQLSFALLENSAYSE